MSYSFQVKGASKDEALKLAAEQFDLVVSSQPVHAADKEAALKVAEAFVGLLAEPTETEVVIIGMNGSLGWRKEGEFTSANVNVNAYFGPKA